MPRHREEQAAQDRKLIAQADKQIRQTQAVIDSAAEQIKKNQEHLDSLSSERGEPFRPHLFENRFSSEFAPSTVGPSSDIP